LSCRSRARKTTCILRVPTSVLERRCSFRHPCGWNCSCSPISLKRSNPPWPALVPDISAEGIGLVMNGCPPVGTFLPILLPSATQRERPLRAQIVRLQRAGKRTWVLGCVLNPQLHPDELNSLL